MTSTVSACVSCPGFTSTGNTRTGECPRLLSSAAARCRGLKGLHQHLLKQQRKRMSICWERTSLTSTAVVLETVVCSSGAARTSTVVVELFCRFTLFIQADTSLEAPQRLQSLSVFVIQRGNSCCGNPSPSPSSLNVASDDCLVCSPSRVELRRTQRGKAPQNQPVKH